MLGETLNGGLVLGLRRWGWYTATVCHNGALMKTFRFVVARRGDHAGSFASLASIARFCERTFLARSTPARSSESQLGGGFCVEMVVSSQQQCGRRIQGGMVVGVLHEVRTWDRADPHECGLLTLPWPGHGRTSWRTAATTAGVAMDLDSHSIPPCSGIRLANLAQ